MNNNQQPKKDNKASVTHTLVQVEPVATVYNLDSEDVQGFLLQYFEGEGIKSLEAVRLVPVRQDKRYPEAKVYAFFDMNSTETVNRRNNNIPQALQNKMDQGGTRLSSKVFNAVKPLIQGKPRVSVQNSQGQRLAFVELDIFLVVGMMLAARQGVHELNITEVKALRNSTLLTVIKSKAFSKRGNTQSDRFLNIIEKNR